MDLTDEASIIALGERLGTVDHVVSTASSRARGRVAELNRDAVRLSFDTKVLGPLMLARSLALELAPIRVNTISPGVIDTGAWDGLGERGKADYFADMTARNPARRIGTPDDIAQAVVFALTNTFLIRFPNVCKPTRCAGRLRVRCGGALITDSDDVVLLHEPGSPVSRSATSAPACRSPRAHQPAPRPRDDVLVRRPGRLSARVG